MRVELCAVRYAAKREFLSPRWACRGPSVTQRRTTHDSKRKASQSKRAVISYSYLNASTGFSRDALIAGNIPNITPVIALATSAATTAIGGTDA
jgi:hypothetical protein